MQSPVIRDQKLRAARMQGAQQTQIGLVEFAARWHETRREVARARQWQLGEAREWLEACEIHAASQDVRIGARLGPALFLDAEREP